jgi:hypothetical protein
MGHGPCFGSKCAMKKTVMLVILVSIGISIWATQVQAVAKMPK